MSDTRVKCHPTLGILVCTDGHVMVPATKFSKAHWTFGSIRHGYMKVKITGKDYSVHRLVAQTFIPNPENKKEIDHINRNPQDNSVANLRWCSRSENNRNTSSHDRVEVQGRTHKYEDEQQYKREKNARYYKAKCKTHQLVHFADGIQRWIPHEAARELLKIPVKQRVFNK